jgi:nucleoid-associated protein YgaU
MGAAPISSDQPSHPVAPLYTVQPEDEQGGLMLIAHRIYGASERWTLIFEVNRHIVGTNPNVIRAGQQLALPGLKSEGARDQAIVYTVRPEDMGDGLAGIARRLCGSAERWEWLYAINRGVIGDDPARILPGQCLIIACN